MKMKLKIKLFGLILLSNLSYAKSYQWIHLDKTRLDRAKCFEVSEDIDIKNLKESEITEYFKRVDAKNCRPEKVVTLFNGGDGNCYSADQETNGKKFLEKIKTEDCRPEKYEFKHMTINDKTKCFEIDSKTQGEYYYKPTKSENCVGSKSAFVWEPRDLKKGTCFDISSGIEKKFKVKDKFCRPDEVVFTFVKGDKFFLVTASNKAINPDDPYSKKVKEENCRPKETSYFFYKEPGKTYGKCYEVDSETNGEKFIQKVESKLCQK